MLKQFSKNHPLAVFFIIMIIFVTPLVLAWTLINTHHTLHQRTTNFGQFVKPPLKINRLVLKDTEGKRIDSKAWHGKWVMLYVNPNVICDRACETQLLNMRQIRLATGKHMDKVARVIISFDEGEPLQRLSSLVRRRYPGTVVAHTSRDAYQEFAQQLTGLIYFVDPYGNLMMSFGKNVPRAHVFKDLQHLLRVN